MYNLFGRPLFVRHLRLSRMNRSKDNASNLQEKIAIATANVEPRASVVVGYARLLVKRLET